MSHLIPNPMAQTNYNYDGLSAEDKALNTFSDLMILC